MPHRLKQRQEKIQDKRKHTPWREFVKEIGSWYPLVFYKNSWNISRYPVEKQSVHWKEKNTFFTNLSKLLDNAELPNLFHRGKNENCDYSDVIVNCRNIYLSFWVVTDCENILYSFSVRDYCRNILDSTIVWWNCENVYHSSMVYNSSKIFYSKKIFDSNNCWYSQNLVWCNDCYECSNLSYASYCIRNKKYSKEEYQLLIKNRKQHWRFKDIILEKEDTNNFCDAIENTLFSYNIKNWRNCILAWCKEGNQDLYDMFAWWSPFGTHYYWLVSWGWGDHFYCSWSIKWGSKVFYSYFLDECSYCLGCIWLKNKSYCILNKQYTKEERYDKVDEIFTQMEKDWTLGKFFPWSMNPFYFNDTAAYLIDDSFTKEEVEAEWYLRRDEKIKVDIPEGAEIVRSYCTSTQNRPPLDPLLAGGAEASRDSWSSQEWQKGKVPPCERGHPNKVREGGKNNRESIDDYQGRKVGDKFYPISEIWDKVPKTDSGAERWIDPEILNKVIQDKEWNYYKIVKMEYDFLMKHGLPLPKLHWLDRIKLGFKFK